MKLTARARYTLRLMSELARLSTKQSGPVRLSQIAKITGISRKYLEQLAAELKRHKLIRGITGRNGGYCLERDPSSITVGQILEAVIGPVDLSICIDSPETCMRSDYCECRCIWVLLNHQIRKVLHSHTLADLVEPDALRRLHLLSAEVEEL